MHLASPGRVERACAAAARQGKVGIEHPYVNGRRLYSDDGAPIYLATLSHGYINELRNRYKNYLTKTTFKVGGNIDIKDGRSS